MIKLSCPACGAEVCFRSKASVFAVCRFCQSTLVRHDMNVESIGKMAELQDDLTPLQIGTTGYFDKKKFEIIGRLKVGYDQGFWNEWYLLFPNEQEAWLAEAQGFYAVCFPFTGKYSSVPNPDQISPSMLVQLPPDGTFQIEDIREVKCLFSEGELPMNARQGRESTSVDLTSDDNQMATIEYAKDSVRVFMGSYQDFDDFKFQNLREIDGW